MTGPVPWARPARPGPSKRKNGKGLIRESSSIRAYIISILLEGMHTSSY